MKIEIIKCLTDNFSYLLINEKNLDTCVVDPGDAKPVLEKLIAWKIYSDKTVFAKNCQNVDNKKKPADEKKKLKTIVKGKIA